MNDDQIEAGKQAVKTNSLWREIIRLDPSLCFCD